MRKRKIVFIMNNFFIGGAEKLLLNILSRLDKEKFKIYIVTVLGSGAWENNFKKLGFPIRFLAFKIRSITLVYKVIWILLLPFIILRLLFFLIKINPEIVVTSLYQADILGIFSARLAGIKKRIIIQHDVKRIGSFRKNIKEILAIHFATNIIANSNSTKEFLTDYFGTFPQKISVINNGVDVEKIKEDIKPKKTKDNLILGFMGRLEPIKGPIYLLEALKILKEEEITPKTYVAGEGIRRKFLEKYANNHNLNNVEFEGGIVDVLDFFKKIDILVVPSLSEGFGLTLLEGLVAGKVLVASDIPAFREIIIDGENGKLFPPGDAKTLSSILKELFLNKDLFKRIRESVKLWVKKNKGRINIETTVKQYEKVFTNF